MSGVVNEKDHFLNERQKEVKAKIMEDCLNGVFDNIKDNFLYFDAQSLCDLVGSILVMFNREVIGKLFETIIPEYDREEFLNVLFKEIKEQVKLKLNKNLS